MATIRNCNQAQKQQIQDCLKGIKKRLEAGAPAGLIPESKRKKLLGRIKNTAVIHCGGRHCAANVAGYTDRAGSPNVHICRQTFGMKAKRLCAVILHELVHSCGSYELDCEIIENIIFPPDEGGAGKGGGTWPAGNDCRQFCLRTRRRTDGLRESDLYIWDPVTGKVWERTSDGNKGPQIWTDPAVLAKWRCECPESEAEGPLVDGPLIDYVEPGSFPGDMEEDRETEEEGGCCPPSEGEGDVPGGDEVLIDYIEEGSFPEDGKAVKLITDGFADLKTLLLSQNELIKTCLKEGD